MPILHYRGVGNIIAHTFRIALLQKLSIAVQRGKGALVMDLGALVFKLLQSVDIPYIIVISHHPK